MIVVEHAVFCSIQRSKSLEKVRKKILDENSKYVESCSYTVLLWEKASRQPVTSSGRLLTMSLILKYDRYLL
jgi:hypothetical protein